MTTPTVPNTIPTSLNNYNDQLYIEGRRFEIPALSSSAILDVSFSFDTKLTGIQLTTINTAYGDYLDFTIEHPTDGTILTVGKTLYLPDSVTDGKSANIPIVDAQAIPIATGQIFRFKLTAVDTLGRRCIVWLMLRR